MSTWPEGIAPDEVQQLVEESFEDFWQWLIRAAEKKPREGKQASIIHGWLPQWLKLKRAEWRNTPPALRHYWGCEKTPTVEE